MLSDDDIVDNIRCNIQSLTALTAAAEPVGAVVHLHCSRAVLAVSDVEHSIHILRFAAAAAVDDVRNQQKHKRCYCNVLVIVACNRVFISVGVV